MRKKVAKNNRDDFSPKTKEILRSRVNGVCSNPHCGRPTIGPGSDAKGILNLGIACHIAAASPGGARYDKQMTPEERKDFSNGIWLCVKCSGLIDKDWRGYSEAVLHTWKKMAEQCARNGIENNYSTDPTKGIHPSLHGVQLFSEIGALDHRFEFSLNVSYGKLPEIEMRAKELVDFQISAKPGFEEVVNHGFEKFFKFGEPFSVARESLDISGSKLFETIGRGGRVDIGGSGIESQYRITLFSNQGSPVNSFHTSGPRWSGENGAKLDFELLSGMLKFTIYIEMIADLQSVKVKFEFDLSSWLGVSVFELSSINWIELIVRNCAAGGFLRIEMKHDEQWIRVVGKMMIPVGDIAVLDHLVEYAIVGKELAREIAKNLTFQLPKDGDLTAAGVRGVIHSLRSKVRHKGCHIDWPVSMSGLDLRGSDLCEVANLGSIKVLEADSCDQINAFGQAIELPPRELVFSKVVFAFGQETEGLQNLSLSPTDDTYFEVSYPSCLRNENR
ncbi:MAG: hypothetical protein IPO40_18705 [Fibrobacteres bacterium]|nr:hypothetical protein [Fibrobacterota bacterium]